jgi:hypothetical protein
MPPEQVDDRTKTVAQLLLPDEGLQEGAEWGKKWLDKHPGDEDMSVLLGQSYYVMNDYKNAATTMGSRRQQRREGRPHSPGELAADRAELALQARQQGRHRGRAEEARALLPEGPTTGKTCSTSIVARTPAIACRSATTGLMNETGTLKQADDMSRWRSSRSTQASPAKPKPWSRKGCRQVS